MIPVGKRPKNPVEEGVKDTIISQQTEPLWTVADVAKYLRLGADTIRSKARSGEIPAIRVGKEWRFKPSKIKDWLYQIEMMNTEEQ